MNDARHSTVKIGDARLLRVSASCLRRNSDAKNEHGTGDSYATTE